MKVGKKEKVYCNVCFHISTAHFNSVNCCPVFLQGMVEELSSGPCVAMELVVKDKTKNTAVEFRKIVGPCDPVNIQIYKIPFILWLSRFSGLFSTFN